MSSVTQRSQGSHRMQRSLPSVSWILNSGESHRSIDHPLSSSLITVSSFQMHDRTMGPSSYDIGHVIGQLLLSAVLVQAFCDVEESEAAEEGLDSNEAAFPSIVARKGQVAWLLSSVQEAHDELVKVLAAAAATSSSCSVPVPPLQDILGYAGCCIIRWSIGQFNLFAPYLSPVSVAMCDSVYRAVLIGTTLLRERKTMQVSEAIEIAKLALKESSS
jgi:5-methylthioribose kinase